MPPITTYGSIEGLLLVGANANALSSFSATQKREALEGASRLIDTFMKGFTLPFVAVGTDVHRAANIIATYDLLSGRGLDPEGRDKNIRDRYDDTMKWLAMVADGSVRPNVTDSTPQVDEYMPRPRVISAPSRGYSVRGTGARRGPFQSE